MLSAAKMYNMLSLRYVGTELTPRANPVLGIAGDDITIIVDVTSIVNATSSDVTWTLGHTLLEITSNSKYRINTTSFPLVSLTILDAIEADINSYTLSVTDNGTISTLAVNVSIQG